VGLPFGHLPLTLLLKPPYTFLAFPMPATSYPISPPTKCMQHSSWETDYFLASQEISLLFWSPKIHQHVHRSPPAVRVLNQVNPVRALPPRSVMFYFNIILSSTPRPSKWSSTFNVILIFSWILCLLLLSLSVNYLLLFRDLFVKVEMWISSWNVGFMHTSKCRT
jgi:hypothetical protein